MTTGTSDKADASSFTSPVTPHSDLEPEQFSRLANQSLNYRHQYEPDYSIDPCLRSDSQEDVSSKKRKIEALTTYPEASTLSLSPHVHIEDRGRSRFSSRSPVMAQKSKCLDESCATSSQLPVKQSQVLQRLKQIQRSRIPTMHNPTASTRPSSMAPPPSGRPTSSSKPASYSKLPTPSAPRSAPPSHPPVAAVTGRTTTPKPVPSSCPFLTEKGLASKASKSKPTNSNLMQPIRFATPRNANSAKSAQRMAAASHTPPAHEDDTDDDLLESRTLLQPAKGPSQKERASAHSKTQLQASHQHNYIESSQTEILRLRKEQARLSDHHAAMTTRLEGEIESLIKRIEALEIHEPAALVATGVRNNAMNSAIRQVLFKMMGIEFNEALPDPLDGKDNYWTEIDFLDIDGMTTMATRVLRPKWPDSWTNNSKWHKSFFERFRRDASNYEPMLSQDAIKEIPDKTLQSVAGKVFKTLKESYKEGNRPIGLQSRNVAIARREKRQIDKSKLAIEARKNLPDLKDQQYDFAFASKWQSMDYSASDASHQSSSDEVDIVVNKRRKAYKKPKKEDIFTTHPPAWRSKDYRNLSQLIKDKVEQIVAERDADKKNWMKKRHNTLKTPQWAVSTRWLKSLMQEDRERQEALMTDDHDADMSYSETSSSKSG
ncbi:hypothetical protein EV424DRAFT_1547959 [Suillus variegatus]|nr:hypothetical protein EV424DRAFT_1547959 [Suillus variegatus]